MRQKKFDFFLDQDRHVKIRSFLETESGIVERFSVQLELDDRIINRFDNTHGYVHQHKFKPDGTQVTRQLRFSNNNEAFNNCYQYTKENWKKLVEDFERRL